MVQLPFPATDLSWCPAKAGTDNASFLTACNSQPLQLWDCEDGALRASYVAANGSGNHTHPRCCGWLPTSTGQLLAVGGYGGHEDRTPVRFFDVLYEGSTAVYAYDSSFHAGASSSNNVVSAVAAGPRGTQGLALAGYRNHATVDVIDVRHRCPAAVLTGHGDAGMTRGCIRTIRTHPVREHLVFASGARHAQSPGSEHILCWDLRKPSAPLVAMDRGPSPSHQVCDFVFVKGGRAAAAPESAGNDFSLVSTSAAGGLYAFDLAAALLATGTVVNTRPIMLDELGVTSGIASLEKLDESGRVADAASTGTVAVVVGGRMFTYDAATSCPTHKKARAETEGRGAANAVPRRDEADEESDEDADRDSGSFLRSYRKRPVAPFDDGDDEPVVRGPTAAATSSAKETAAEPGLNVVVVTLPL